MKYPRPASTPSSLLVWLEDQLERRGIDGGVYTRYILSLLIPSWEPPECDHTSYPRIPQLGYRREHCRGNKIWHLYQAEWDLCSCTSSPTLESKKSAAIECLKAVTEQQEFGLETLIEEICEKLQNLTADLELFGKESSHLCHPTPPPSPKEHKQKYYDAFPSLSENVHSPPQRNSSPLGSKENFPAEMTTESSLVIPLLPFTKIKCLVKKKKPFLDHEPCVPGLKNSGFFKSPKSKRKKENQESPVKTQDGVPQQDKCMEILENGKVSPNQNCSEAKQNCSARDIDSNNGSLSSQQDLPLKENDPPSDPSPIPQASVPEPTHSTKTEQGNADPECSPSIPAEAETAPTSVSEADEFKEEEDMLFEQVVGKENVVPLDLSIKYNLFSESLWPPYNLSYKEDKLEMEHEDLSPQLTEPGFTRTNKPLASNSNWTIQSNGSCQLSSSLQGKNEDLDQELDSSLQDFTKINKPLAINSNWTFQSNGVYSSQYNVVQARKSPLGVKCSQADVESLCYINGFTCKPYMSSSLDEKRVSPTFFLRKSQLASSTSTLLAYCDKLKGPHKPVEGLDTSLKNESVIALSTLLDDSSFYPLDPFPLLSNNYTFMNSRILYKRLEEESRVYHIWKPSSNSSSMETLSDSPLSKELLSNELSCSYSLRDGGESPLGIRGRGLLQAKKLGKRYNSMCNLGPLESPSCGGGGGDSLSSEGSLYDDLSLYSPDTHLEEEREVDSPSHRCFKADFHKSKSRALFQEAVAAAAKRPCTYFMEGSCLKPNCRFSHNLKTITCKFWLMNQCFKGDTCPFLHGFVPKKGAATATKNEKVQQQRFTLESELDFPPLTGGMASSKKKQQG